MTDKRMLENALDESIYTGVDFGAYDLIKLRRNLSKIGARLISNSERKEYGKSLITYGTIDFKGNKYYFDYDEDYDKPKVVLEKSSKTKDSYDYEDVEEFKGIEFLNQINRLNRLGDNIISLTNGDEIDFNHISWADVIYVAHEIKSYQKILDEITKKISIIIEKE